MIRPLRGRVVVRELTTSGLLWRPQPDPRKVQTHTGKVLAMGPPARAGDADIEPGFAVGDVVQYHFTHLEEAATLPWTDGQPAVWLPQECVDAVWEAECTT